MAVEIKPRFFRDAAAFRGWLEKSHDKVSELWVGFYRKSSGRKGISYSEAVDEALCFGWIDGLKKRFDDESYMLRFTPRKVKSNWSVVNVKRVEALKKLGRMALPGLSVFEARDPSRLYSYEDRPHHLAPALEKRFRASKRAWEFFQALPPGYQRTLKFWVMSPKQEETRLRRLDKLIAASARGQRL